MIAFAGAMRSLYGLTEKGRATVAVLDINRPPCVIVREALIADNRGCGRAGKSGPETRNYDAWSMASVRPQWPECRLAVGRFRPWGFWS